MITESQRPNDCAIVALCNYFGVDYAEVVTELLAIAVEKGVVWNIKRETPNAISWEFCRKRGLIQRTVPRRGQEKISGIVSLHSAGARLGHMVVMIDGIVFDAFFPEGIPIKEYQTMARKHIRAVWR